MKKLLLLLLCVPLMFSCGEETDNLQREITQEMIDDGYTGKGTKTYADGSKYVGEFKDNNPHGQGTVTYTDGIVEKGLWENGNFIGEE